MMISPTFTPSQRVDLANCGLSRAQIVELEKTLLLAKLRMDAMVGDVPRMQDVRKVLSKSRDVLLVAQEATIRLLNPDPKAAAVREAAQRVMMADQDGDPAQDDEAIKNAFHALLEAGYVLDQALADLPTGQRRKRTSIDLFRKIDEALMNGFIKDKWREGQGLPAYDRIAPSRGGVYKEIMRIYFDALDPTGDELRDADQGIKNHIANEKKTRVKA